MKRPGPGLPMGVLWVHLWRTHAQTWPGVERNELVCSNAAGERLGDYQALAAALAGESAARVAAEQARDSAEQRAAAAEARLRELEAELRRLRGAG